MPYPPPPPPGTATRTLTLPVPDDGEYRALLYGVIATLTDAANYDDTTDGQTAADKFGEMLDNATW